MITTISAYFFATAFLSPIRGADLGDHNDPVA